MRHVLLALALLAGCASPNAGCGVDVETSARRGRGVIVSPTHVMTVDHVVGEAEVVLVEGRLLARPMSRTVRETETGSDGLVLLELVRGRFDDERVARVARTPGPGVVYLTARGEIPWPWRIEPGDSGSPILDADGRVTGLVRAVFGKAEALDEGRVAALAGKAPRE